MEKEFISYEQALILKELGFNEPCFGWWFVDEKMLFIEKSKKSTSDNILQAPLKQQVLRWFREKYELHGYIEGIHPWCRYYINSQDDRWEGHKYNTYEECENSLTNKLIEIVKNKP